MVVAPGRGRQYAAQSARARAREHARSGMHRRDVEFSRMPDGESPAERVLRRRGVGEPVLVAAPDRGEARVEAIRRERRPGAPARRRRGPRGR